MYIYKITNLKNGKIYIGKCVRNVYSSKNYFGSGIYLKNAITLYGRENFKKEILEHADNKNNLKELEKYWIAKYDCKAPTGYNLTDGGDGGNGGTNKGKKYPLSGRLKMRVAKLGKPTWNKGIKYEDVWGKEKAQEFKDKVSKSVNANPPPGICSTAELEVERRKKIASKNYKQYTFIDPQGNEHITTNGVKEFCKEHGLTRECMQLVINGTYPQHKGWKVKTYFG